MMHRVIGVSRYSRRLRGYQRIGSPINHNPPILPLCTSAIKSLGRLRVPRLYRSFSSAAATFVSSYYQLENPHELQEFMQRKNMIWKDTETHYVIRECPFCPPIRGKRDNMFKLYVHKSTGMYKCHRCGVSGGWLRFKNNVQVQNGTNCVEIGSTTSALYGHTSESRVITALDNAKAMAIQRNLMEDDAFSAVRAYLTCTRGIEERVLIKYGVGAIEQPFYEDQTTVMKPCISFPWMARPEDIAAMGLSSSSSSTVKIDTNQFDVIRLKLRAVDDKSQQRLIPKGGSWGLFGWNTVPTSAEEIVVTEGEFDAMAVYQATGKPAISLPNGCQSLPPAILPLLERFKKIYLWMDNDASGQANVDKFASKLGMSRCAIVRPPVHLPTLKDANEALLSTEPIDMNQLLLDAEIIPHSQITTFEELRRQVYEEIRFPLRMSGVQSRQLPSLNRILKGHRLGEVTVLTGPTGCGKTTLLSQLSLDWCGQGVNTLWGSFEIKNTRLIHKMLTQLAGRSLTSELEIGEDEEEQHKRCFDAIADQFEALPMYFLRFFGSTDVDDVLEAMEFAVYAYDVQHILLDNVQFMMAGQGRGFDKFERQDAALDKFRKFASHKNIHLTLVVHPRKEQEDVELTLSSVFGTAKATQEADNVLILQRIRGQTKLDIRKNRFDGTLGSIPLVFDPQRCCLKEEKEEMMDPYMASIDLESSYSLQQKVRQKKEESTAEYNETTERMELIPLDTKPTVCEVHGLNGTSQVEPFSTFTPMITR